MIYRKPMTKTVDLFKTGIRPAIEQYLAAEAAKERDYGDYWSASSAGYCMRRLIFERLGVPKIGDEVDEARKQRIFSAGHTFHDWIQSITKASGLSIAQELELQDEELMVRGHIDDLVLVNEIEHPDTAPTVAHDRKHLVLYDYKTQHSKSFHWNKKEGNPVSYYHRLQVGTYMHMLRSPTSKKAMNFGEYLGIGDDMNKLIAELDEARVLKISKDDLTMLEHQILWDLQLELDVVNFWTTLNEWWSIRKIPPCTCHEQENGFLAREAYNPYFYNGEPCSLEYFNLNKKETA